MRTWRGIRSALAALLAVVSLSSLPSSARTICEPDARPGGEWRRMGYDLAHSRHQPDERSIGRVQAATLQPAWTFSANEASGGFWNEITGYPIVADGCVFVGSSTGRDAPGWIFALNADGGDLSWKRALSHGVYSTLAVEDGVVYAFVSRIGSPYVVALDQRDGRMLWRTTVDTQPGSDAVSSPVVYNGMVWVGVSGTAAEGDEETRFDFRGSSVLLDASASCSDHSVPVAFGDETMTLTTECFNAVPGATGGRVLAHAFSIPDDDWDEGAGDAGGAIWSTISIDPASGFGFVGTGNPFNYEDEHAHTNAIVKIDLRRTVAGSPNPSFGQIVGSYKGEIEEYFPEVSDNYSCDEEDYVGFFMAGFECGRLDLDFGASPNLFRTRTGKLLVGAGQKSGVYHAVDPVTMTGAWKQIMGVPSAVGGIVGTAAYDGTALYVPHTLAGYLASLDRDGAGIKWASPTADAVHWGNPATSANGVIYTVDLKGFIDAFDAATGAPLMHRPLSLGANTGLAPTLSWGGVTVARNTVYASVGVGLTSAGGGFPSMPNGFVIAYRPARTL
ncbi:MAG TPA: PQQ-binding-like beta-propeller repeat protein [Actinomycetota bacterium]|nr:PQQ-binding-like beta-propeller repeat protein [Actinomycetota bacterium]